MLHLHDSLLLQFHCSLIIIYNLGVNLHRSNTTAKTYEQRGFICHLKIILYHEIGKHKKEPSVEISKYVPVRKISMSTTTSHHLATFGLFLDHTQKFPNIPPQTVVVIIIISSLIFTAGQRHRLFTSLLSIRALRIQSAPTNFDVIPLNTPYCYV